MDNLSYPDVTQWAIPFFAAAILAEIAWILIKGRGGRYETRDAMTSLIMGAGNVASGILLGFHPAMVLFCGGINLVYQFWIHTEAIGKLPRWVEAIMNTPSHHRVHHWRNPRYLDANYAGVFIIWDKMFGTFVPEQDDEKVDFGLVHNLGTFNPLRVAFHEWVGIFKDMTQRGITLRDRLMYALAPPGWSHDGSRETSETIKAKHLARHPEDRGTPGFDQG